MFCLKVISCAVLLCAAGNVQAMHMRKIASFVSRPAVARLDQVSQVRTRMSPFQISEADLNDPKRAWKKLVEERVHSPFRPLSVLKGDMNTFLYLVRDRSEAALSLESWNEFFAQELSTAKKAWQQVQVECVKPDKLEHFQSKSQHTFFVLKMGVCLDDVTREKIQKEWAQKKNELVYPEKRGQLDLAEKRFYCTKQMIERADAHINGVFMDPMYM